MTTEPTPAPAPGERAPDEPLPRIYVASLTDYNAGILHGTWIHADVDDQILHEVVADMLATSPTTARYGDAAEEVAIHDFEGFGPVHLHEYENLTAVTALARGIRRHGTAFAAWWTTSEPTNDPDDLADDRLDTRFEDSYIGTYPSLSDYGDQILDDHGLTDPSDLQAVPETFRAYVRIDIDAYLRDLQLGGDISTIETNNEVHIFWSNP